MLCKQFDLKYFPQHGTPSDCGVFSVLYIWMALACINEGQHWLGKFDIQYKETQMISQIRHFLCYLIMELSKDKRAIDYSEYCDSPKWIGMQILMKKKR